MSKEFIEYQEEKNRVLEAGRLLKIIDPQNLSTKDTRFYFQMEKKLKSDFCTVSKEAIYWLRDIKDRQLEKD